MWWFYKLKSINDGIYTYYYSRESKDCDGLISYDTETEEIKVIQLCAADQKYGQFAEDSAIRGFYRVIDENFPDTREVACG